MAFCMMLVYHLHLKSVLKGERGGCGWFMYYCYAFAVPKKLMLSLLVDWSILHVCTVTMFLIVPLAKLIGWCGGSEKFIQHVLCTLEKPNVGVKN